jgi:hypothetical protein
MKDSVGLLLVGALFMSAIMAIWQSWNNHSYVSELQELYANQVTVNNTRAAAQGLASEAVEYSRNNPAIDPILFQYELKARPGTATNQPAASKP